MYEQSAVRTSESFKQRAHKWRHSKSCNQPSIMKGSEHNKMEILIRTMLRVQRSLKMLYLWSQCKTACPAICSCYLQEGASGTRESPEVLSPPCSCWNLSNWKLLNIRIGLKKLINAEKFGFAFFINFVLKMKGQLLFLVNYLGIEFNNPTKWNTSTKIQVIL